MAVDSESEGPGRKDPENTSMSQDLLQRVLNPTFLGEIPAPDGYAYLRGDCGDSMEVFLTVRDRRIGQARFDTLGCGFTVACGNAAMELAEGRPLSQALRITPQRIAEVLGGLPSSHEHCAELAVACLKKAIEDSLTRHKESWKNMYRNR